MAYAVADRLFGSVSYMRRPKGEPVANTSTGEKKRPFSKEQKQSCVVRNAQIKKNNQKLSKETEAIQCARNTEEAQRFAYQNNAAGTHLVAFVKLAEYAESASRPLALGVMGKTLKEQDVGTEWKLIQKWLGKHSPKVCAVSIGRRPKGRWVLRMIAVGEQGEEDSDHIENFRHYLRKRGWRGESFAADRDASMLKEHYLTRKDDAMETLAFYLLEMFEVARASLVLYGRSRTYKTNKTTYIIDQQANPVEDDAAYVINGIKGIGGNTASGRAFCIVEVQEGTVVAAWPIQNEKEARELYPEGVEPEVLVDF